MSYACPYFRCKNPRVDGVEVVVRCPDPNCPNPRELPDRFKFCSLCGKPLERTTRPVRRNAFDRYANHPWDERLTLFCLPEEDLWLPKESEMLEYQFGRRFPVNDVLVVTPELISQERSWLVEHFAAERRMLDESYGGGNVEVFWGVVQLDQ